MKNKNFTKKSLSVRTNILLASLLFLLLCIITINCLNYFFYYKGKFSFWLLAACILFVLLLTFFWKKYFFTEEDLKELIQSKNGKNFCEIKDIFILNDSLNEKIKTLSNDGSLQLFSYARHYLLQFLPNKNYYKVRINDLWVCTELLKLKYSFLPVPTIEDEWDNFNKKLEVKSRSILYFPTKSGRINIFKLGDFSRFSPLRLEIYQDLNFDTGNTILDEALSKSSDHLKGLYPRISKEILEATKNIRSEDSLINLEITDEWLRVEIIGGRWLGGKFTDRISMALDFTNDLISNLYSHFTPKNPDEWTVDFQNYEFKVSKIN